MLYLDAWVDRLLRRVAHVYEGGVRGIVISKSVIILTFL